MSEVLFDENLDYGYAEIPAPIICKHYAEIDENSNIITIWNDVIQPWRFNITPSAVPLGEWEGAQPRLFPDGEVDPALFDWEDMIPLYKWDGTQVLERTQDEIEADRAVKMLPQIRAAKEAELSTACNAAIVAGMDVETSVGTEHFSLQETDQINLTTATNAVQNGAAGYPYHADGSLCRMFTAEEIMAIAQASISHKLYHTTLCNHLLTWARRAGTVEEIKGITYSAEGLPEDLSGNMAGIFTAATGGL